MGRGLQAPLPAEVDEVRAKMKRWRQQRKRLGPMPDQLWAEAGDLASPRHFGAIGYSLYWNECCCLDAASYRHCMAMTRPAHLERI
jgi:hypothetical protein